ncbi:MAG: alpha/beta hydrolase [Acidobacteriota bacterium]|nr:alpha/beta hydrolase [Acidobacteriota bacterium]
MRRWLRVTLYFITGFYIVFALVAFFLADQMMFYPRPSSYREDAKIMTLRTADGKAIAAMYLPNPQAKFTILYSHGNAEDIGDLEPLFQQLHDAGFAVFGYDYEGYGTSEGRPSERATYADIDAAYAFLTQTQRMPPARVIVFGRSVGSGPAIDLAARQPVGGLIIQSGFTSAFRVLTRVPLLPFDKFRNLYKLKQVRCPVLVMHGKRDGVIPFHHGKRLFEAAPGPKWSLWVDAAGHNDFEWQARNRYLPAIHDFASHLAD